MKLRKHDGTTHNIANKGFSGVRSIVARSNFPCTLIGNRPQSLTGHIVNVGCNCKNTTDKVSTK
jgi:hypothetical protein